MRGFVQGSLWALVVGSFAFGFVSLINEPPVLAEGPPAPQLVMPELVMDMPSQAVAVSITQEQAPQFPQELPRVAVPFQEETAPVVAFEPDAPPQTTEVATALSAPTNAIEPDVASAVDAPIFGETPVAPSGSGVLITRSDPPLVQDSADIPPLAVEDASAALTSDEETVSSVGNLDVTDAQTDEGQAIILTPDMSAPEVSEENVALTEEEAVETQVPAPLIVITDVPSEPLLDTMSTDAPVVSSETDPALQTSQDVALADVPSVVVPNVDETDAPTAADTTLLPVPTAVESTPEPSIVDAEPAPLIVQTAPTEPEVDVETSEIMATQSDTSVRINRPGTDLEEPVIDDAGEAQAETLQEDAPALLRYAAAFENPSDLPLISVVLIDQGAMPDAAEKIAALGFQPTVVLDALAEKASAQVAAYRASAIEVAMQIDLPTGAQPTDVEVAFEAAFGIVSDATMLFSDGTGIMQSDRRVTEQVMQILAADGRGFVSIQRGLGNAVRAAEQEGVPAVVVLRDLDGAGESALAIGRALDQAALRARQTGGAVLMGRITPQTLTILADWAAGLDTERLLIAPVSAVLLDQSE